MEIKINGQITLELFSEDTAQAFYQSIHEIKNYNDTYRINLQRKYPKLDDVRRRIEDAIYNKYRKDGTPDFFIYKNNKIIGIFEFHPMSKEDHLEVGFWLFQEQRKKGILTEIFPHMINYAKENFKKSKLMATTPLGNVPSQKLLEKVGFQKSDSILQVDNGQGKIEKELVYFFPLRD